MATLIDFLIVNAADTKGQSPEKSRLHGSELKEGFLTLCQLCVRKLLPEEGLTLFWTLPRTVSKLYWSILGEGQR